MAFDEAAHPRAEDGTFMAFDAKKGTGTGYGKKGGDTGAKALQSQLNRLGFQDADGKKLDVDGKVGPKTTAAIKKAQRALGLPATGKVNAAFVKRLKGIKNPGEARNTGQKMSNDTSKKPAGSAKGTGKKLSSADPEKKTKAPPAKGKKKPAAPAEKKVAHSGPRRRLEGTELTEQVHGSHEGRILEAKGADEGGGRIYRVRVIKYGDSKNRRRYPEAVMRRGSRLYEGTKAYDHHRTDDELRTSTVSGMVGWYENVAAGSDGLYADLHLLPSATHVAEALDASLELQQKGLPPLLGTSHDVTGSFRPVAMGGRMVQEATEITSVASVDIVASPSAGGIAVRAVAGGLDDDEGPGPSEGDDVPVSLEDVLEALQEADAEQLAAVGLMRAAEADEDDAPEEGDNKDDEVEETSAENERETPVTESELLLTKNSALARLTVAALVKDAGLPEKVTESIIKALPDRFTESAVEDQVAQIKRVVGFMERDNLTPTTPSVTVVQESHEKKVEALDNFFMGKFGEGYSSFRQAFMDFTGKAPKSFTEDFNRTILRESIGHFNSHERASEARATEAMDTTTWNLALGDSITRRMMKEYATPGLQSWKSVVSSTVPVNDFRTQRIDRIGGYGVLPSVSQGAPYQPLVSPEDEEVTYSITKRGGTEEITLEMIANDDVRAISKIPTKLGRAAAQTLFRFVWEFVNPTTNPVIYDGVNLYHNNHANTDTNAFSQANVSVGRRKMRDQAGYGDSLEILSLTPKILIVPNELEEHAWEVVTSTVAMPSGAPVGAASDVPNLHQGMQLIVLDYWTDDTAWVMVADPNDCPTIELGFYQGRETPELFTQSDPSVGSMFDADKLTYKIRHIYSGAVLDYRAFYRGNT